MDHSYPRRISKKVWYCLGLALPLLSIYGLEKTLAAEVPAAVHKTTPPKKQQIVTENLYFFTVRSYDPPVKVTPIRQQAESSYHTPEEAVLSLLSAMFRKDYEGWFLSWNELSRKEMQESDRTAKRSPSFWIQKWEENLQGKTAELVSRVETGQYVIVEYRLVPLKATASPTQGFVGKIALKAEQGKWLATQELSSDPVFLNWKNPQQKMQFLIRDVPSD
jgi:hypothetical protein